MIETSKPESKPVAQDVEPATSMKKEFSPADITVSSEMAEILDRNSRTFGDTGRVVRTRAAGNDTPNDPGTDRNSGGRSWDR